MARFLILVVAALCMGAAQLSDNPVSRLDEQRYCGDPARDADGRIKRSSAVLTAFRHSHPCPVTGLPSGSCPDWQIDHVIPLACGGCDAVSNLQWLPVGLKTAPVIGKDRFERKIYCTPMETVP